MNPELLLSRIRVVLCRPSHPGNIGSAARAMKTMGLSALYLVQPRQFPDPEAVRLATAAVDVLESARIEDSLADALRGTVFAVALSARARDLGPAVLTPRPMMALLLEKAMQGEVALVFGNESSGLDNREIELCQALVSIPTNPACSSLNLAAAVQVLAYEARMAAWSGEALAAPGKTTPLSAPLATHEEVEGLHAHLEMVMRDTGFYNPAQPGRLLARLRRLFGRIQLERDEVNILRGILSATQQPTRHGRR